jgi:hypothetical protein
MSRVAASSLSLQRRKGLLMGPRFSKAMSSSGVSQDKLNQGFSWITLYQSVVRDHFNNVCAQKPRYCPKTSSQILAQIVDGSPAQNSHLTCPERTDCGQTGRGDHFLQADLSFPIRKGRNAPAGKHVCGFREFRTRRRSKRDEPERLGLPQRLVGLLNELMDLTRCCLVPTG